MILWLSIEISHRYERGSSISPSNFIGRINIPLTNTNKFIAHTQADRYRKCILLWWRWPCSMRIQFNCLRGMKQWRCVAQNDFHALKPKNRSEKRAKCSNGDFAISKAYSWKNRMRVFRTRTPVWRTVLPSARVTMIIALHRDLTR